jgi:hypothetical protein
MAEHGLYAKLFNLQAAGYADELVLHEGVQ